MILLACGSGRNEMPTPMVEFILLPDLNPRVPSEDYTLLLSDDEGNALYYEKAIRFRDTIKVALESDKRCLYAAADTVLRTFSKFLSA